MDNLRSIGSTGFSNNNIQGKFKSATSGATINTTDAFKSSGNNSPGLIQGIMPVGTLKNLQKKEPPKIDKAQFIQQSPDGGYKNTVKIPCDNPDKIRNYQSSDGKDHCVFTSRDGRTVNTISLDGQLEAQVELPGKESAGQVEFSPKTDTMYVRTGQGVHTIDPESGQLKDTHVFSRFGYDRRLAIDKDGDLIMAEDGKLKNLDSQFNVKNSEEIGFRPDEIKYLPGNNLMLLDDSSPAHLMLKDASGNTILNEENLGLHSTIVTGEGTVFAVDEFGIGSGKRDVIKFDPKTGNVSRFHVTKGTDTVIPLKDGSFIAYDNEKTARPRLIGYNKEGEAEWNITFPKEGFLRQTYITGDEKQMYMVVANYKDDDRNPTSTLYRVNVEKGASFFSKALGSFTSVGGSLEAKPLYTGKGDNNSVLPMILDDKRIVIFEEDKIQVLSPTGNKEKTFNNIDELKKELPDSTKSIAQRVFTSYTAEKPLAADKITIMRHARQIYGNKNPKLYSTATHEANPNEMGYSDFDSTLNFQKDIDEQKAMDIMGVKNQDELAKLKEESTILNFALVENIDVPFPKKSNVEQAVVTKNRITIKYDPSTSQSDRSFGVREPVIFSTVLPVTTGNKNYLFAGTSDGTLHWYDLDAGEEKQKFDMGAYVKSIRVSDNNKVIAVTNKGGVFSLEPKMDKNEKLEGDIKMGKMNTQVSNKETATEDDKVVIDRKKRVVTIGGVNLPITGGKYFHFPSAH